MQPPLIREGFLLPAGDVENKVEQLPAHPQECLHQRIDMIIVDEGIPADSLEGLRKAGVEVILVGE